MRCPNDEFVAALNEFVGCVMLTIDHLLRVHLHHELSMKIAKTSTTVGSTQQKLRKESSTGPTSEQKRDRRRAEFAAQAVRVAALRNAGFDPVVRMTFIEDYLDECRTGLYAKMKAGAFPMPQKRGRMSIWPLSVVDAYLEGTWHA